METGKQQRSASSTRQRLESLWRDAIRAGVGPETTIKRTRSGSVGASQSGSPGGRSPSGDRLSAGAPPGYEILRWLGEGGMGVIYRSRQLSTERTVAVKMIRPEGAGRDETRQRFLAEALATADLDHPNIVPVHDLGTDENGCLFYAMREVTGLRWRDVIARRPLDENLDILMRVADAVAFAHARGIIHRDLKPSNVMLGDYGEVFVMDWGLAVAVTDGAKGTRLTSEHAAGGTPSYMAPEMARAETARIGPRSDVYLLGAVLFEIVTGHRPHGGESVLTVIEAAARNELAPTEASGELVAIARRALATEPDDRYPSVKAFQEAIREHLRHAQSVGMADDASAALAEGEASGNYDRYAAAVNGYRHALKLWPGNELAAGRLPGARLAYAECAFRKNDYDLAGSLLDPEWPAHEALARSVDSAKRERDKRRRRVAGLRLAACVSAGIALVLMTVGALWIQDARQAERRERVRAEEALAKLRVEQDRRASERRSAACAMVDSAKQFAEQGDAATAMVLLDTAIDFDPASVEARTTRALLRIDAGAYADASADVEALARLELPGPTVEELGAACRSGGEGALSNAQMALLGRLANGHGMPAAATRLTAPLTERLESCRAKLSESWGKRAYGLKLDPDGDLYMVLAGASEAADLRPLAGIPIRGLLLRASSARDLRPLAGLPLSNVDIFDTDVEDLEPLRGMPLTNLIAGACAFTNLAPLRGMPLRSLNLCGGRVTDLGPLRGLPLRSLNVQNTAVADLGSISDMPLVDLDIGQSQVVDISPLRGLPLRRLSLYATSVRDLTPLSGLPLVDLNLGGTSISSIAPLAGLPLVELDIAGDGAIVDLDPLTGMKLRTLNMHACRVADLSPLAGMPLRYLNMTACRRVADLTPLGGLPLEEISLDPENVTQGIEVLRGMPTLRVINNLSRVTFWEKYDAGEFAVSPIVSGAGRLLGVAKAMALGMPRAELPPREVSGRSGLILSVPPAWHVGGAGGRSCYYPNGNFSAAGEVLAGQIGLGALAWDPATGDRTAGYQNGADGAKSVLQLGNHLFFTGDNGQGIRRLDVDWQNPTSYGNPGRSSPESITTDGALLFANDDAELSRLHAYSVINEAMTFSLEERWVCDLGRGRVRGISYGGNGYLYCSVGASGDDRSVFAVGIGDGKATDLGIDVPGDAPVYGVIRHALGGRDFLLAVDTDVLYVWPLVDDLHVQADRFDAYPRETLGFEYPLYGISVRDDRLFFATGQGMACLMLSVKPVAGDLR